MILVEVETIMPFPIEEVFTRTIDLEKAPKWHFIFTDIKQLNSNQVENYRN